MWGPLAVRRKYSSSYSLRYRVDDGRIGNVGYGFVLLVDGGVLGVDVSKVGAVVSVDVAVPRLGVVIVDGDIGLLIDG